MKKIPSFIKKYLWDVRLETLDIEEHSEFVIERVLEYGDTDSFTWLIKTYDKEKILQVLRNSKKISPKTGNIYAMYFGVPKEQFLCIRKPFIQKQDRF